MLATVGMVGLALALQVPPPSSASTPSADLGRARRGVLMVETMQLSALASRLETSGDREAAEEVRARIEPSPSADGPSRFVPLPEVVPAPAARPSGDAPAWRTEMREVRETSAKALFALAEKAGSARHYALADECLRGVLDRDPDHKEARRLLGYVPHEGGWATPFAAGKLKAGWVNHPTFGWVEGSWVPHLEKGELPAPKARGQATTRWLPAAEADRLHGRWADAWTIATEHFAIRTDVPLSEAIAFSRQLEAFHDLFTALLADVIAVGDGLHLPLAQRFRDKALTGEKPEAPHQVHYFASKEEFVEALTPLGGPGVAGRLGMYYPPRPGQGRRAPAYFFRDPGGQIEATATLYHEVSHQLLFELAGPNAYRKNAGNYWVFEGLGTYFETVVPGPDGSLEVGGLVGPRIEQARVRLVGGSEFIPIEQFVAMGEAEFTGGGDAAMILRWQEAEALAVFLMQARGRAYRDGFLDYVKDAYRGRIKGAVGQTLAGRLGVPYGTLDGQFLDFLKGAGPIPDAR
jgi:hypothetical protein